VGSFSHDPQINGMCPYFNVSLFYNLNHLKILNIYIIMVFKGKLYKAVLTVLFRGNVMIRFKFIFLVFVFLLTPVIILAQSHPLQEKENIYVVVKDIEGNRLEGYLRLYPKEVTVSTKDNKEKSVPLKMIESIKVEKMQGALPGADKLGGESYYFVRLQNSHEIFTLQKKYAFSLNTSVGVVTKNIDPEVVKDSFQKNLSLASKPETSQPFIRDKSVIFSLEIKF
jgi:hypothetical protein